MIKKLQNDSIETAGQIRSVFQLSYAEEAKLLRAVDFPPLKRPLTSYVESGNDFYGYFSDAELAGVIEVETLDQGIDINSLVVKPDFFRRGIGRKLLEFTFKQYDSELFIVETGVDNVPATALYKKLGFKEIKLELT